MKKLGLALGGGGLKGLAHIGVLQVLAENDIKIDSIAGTSAGSIIAALYASGMSPFEMERVVLKMKPQDYLDYNVTGMIKLLASLLFPFYNYRLNGLVLGKKIEKLVYRLTDGKKMDDLNLPIAIISCDIDSGKKVVFTNQPTCHDAEDTIVINDVHVSEAVRCSISIPVTFVPRDMDNRQMVDGGVKDIVPAMVNKLMGAEYVLGINLGQETYHSKVDGLREIILRTLSIMTFETSDTEEKIFADMLVFPHVADTSLDDMEQAARIIRIGRRAMLEHVEALKKALADDR